MLFNTQRWQPFSHPYPSRMRRFESSPVDTTGFSPPISPMRTTYMSSSRQVRPYSSLRCPRSTRSLSDLETYVNIWQRDVNGGKRVAKQCSFNTSVQDLHGRNSILYLVRYTLIHPISFLSCAPGSRWPVSDVNQGRAQPHHTLPSPQPKTTWRPVVCLSPWSRTSKRCYPLH